MARLSPWRAGREFLDTTTRLGTVDRAASVDRGGCDSATKMR
jgi:hypothetical protein